MSEDFDPEAEVVVPIDGTLDLHVFAARDVPEVLDAYLDACLEKGILQVRVVHGKGIGVQKRRVEELLRKDPRVRSFRQAGTDAGGWGATLVELEPSNEGRGTRAKPKAEPTKGGAARARREPNE